MLLLLVFAVCSSAATTAAAAALLLAQLLKTRAPDLFVESQPILRRVLTLFHAVSHLL